MSLPIACAVDFGTTNSSVAIAYEDGVDVLSIGSEELPTSMRSVVYLHRDRPRVGDASGEEAIRLYGANAGSRTPCARCTLVHDGPGQRWSDCAWYSRDGECADARLFSGIKSVLSRRDFETHSWGTDFKAETLSGVVISRLKRLAERAAARTIPRVVLGHPVVFDGAEGPNAALHQSLAEQHLEGAARAAGFGEVRLYPEPAAALASQDPQEGVVVAVDFGGGTFDAAVIAFDGSRGRPLALNGLAVGGDRFDAALFSRVVSPALGLDDAIAVPGHSLDRVGSLSDALHAAGDPVFMCALAEAARHKGGGLQVLLDVLRGGHAYNFYRAIEQAKMALSTETEALIRFRRPGIAVSAPVSRDEFTSLIAPDLTRVREALDAVLSDAGVAPEDVRLVVRTGGSSAIPAFKEILEATLPGVPVEERNPFTAVVEGLAEYARWVDWSA